MAGTQLIGREAVLNAYNAAGIDTWGIFEGKRLVVTGDSSDTLAHWIDTFIPANSRASYTIRMFRDLDAENVRVNSDYSASFNFLIQESAIGGVGNGYSEIIKRLDRLENGTQGAEDDFNFNKIIMGWLKNPAELQIVAGVIKGFFNKGDAVPAAVGAARPGEQPVNSVGDIDRLAGVLDVLGTRDPKLIQHLEKLSKLDDITFSIILQKLDAL